jgi:hypothetical protein
LGSPRFNSQHWKKKIIKFRDASLVIFLEIKPYKYSYLIFNKEAKKIHWRNDILFNK